MRWTHALVALGAVTVLTGIAVPGVRAEVARFFGWHQVRTEAGGGAQTTYDRETPGEKAERRFTRSLAEAREFLGHGVALPPALEGSEMLLYKEHDKAGTLLVVGLSEPNSGFWARYRPAGDHRLQASYGSEFSVSTEQRTVAGRPARVITTVQKSGKTAAELWLEDGQWVYELHDPRGDVSRLIQVAESMQ